MLSKMVKENQRDWDRHLPKALFAYRTAIHEATSYSPFHVTFGRSPTLPVDIMLDRDCLSQEERRNIPEYVDDMEKTLQSMFNDV